jgi:predicted RNA-binding Zn ribbon-like protein
MIAAPPFHHATQRGSARTSNSARETRALPVNQLVFDWDIGHMRPWLTTFETARAIQCSTDHVLNLIEDTSIDAAIDIKAKGARRPCVRVLRESLFRFLQVRSGARQAPTDFDSLVAAHLKNAASVLVSYQIASHLRCSDDHVLNLEPELSLDISRAAATRSYPRTAKAQLIEFIKGRRM